MRRWENVFKQFGKRSKSRLMFEKRLELHSEILNFNFLYVSVGDWLLIYEIKWEHYIFDISYRKRIMNYNDFVSIDVKYVTEMYCLIGTADWFAKASVFDVSCWSR